MILALQGADFECSRIPCYEFRLLPRKIPTSGILAAYASLPLPDRNGGRLVVEWRAGKMRGAPFGLRPCRVRKRLAIKVTFNQNGTTHGSFPTSLIFRKILFPREFYLCRGAIRRERPAFQPALRPSTNLNHFYPVAEMRQGNKLPPHKSRSTGFGSQQPEFAARQTATSESAQTKGGDQNPLSSSS